MVGDRHKEHGLRVIIYVEHFIATGVLLQEYDVFFLAEYSLIIIRSRFMLGGGGSSKLKEGGGKEELLFSGKNIK